MKKKIGKYWAADYEIRVGEDGKYGIYLRDYNVRLAIFSPNSAHLRRHLARIFDSAEARKRKANAE